MDDSRARAAAATAADDAEADDAESQRSVDAADLAVVARQLGRRPRGVHRVAHRCACGQPDVVETLPRLPNGTPFPTLYYLTCPRACSAVSRLEAGGLMADQARRLRDDPALAGRYRRAHEQYLARRAQLGEVAEIAGISAGGMPDRVKCLHVLAAHALAAGAGVNPLGDEALAGAGEWWRAGPCAQAADDFAADPSPAADSVDLSADVAANRGERG